MNDIPVAYLCLGYVEDLGEIPLLEKVGWRNWFALTAGVNAPQTHSLPCRRRSNSNRKDHPV